MITLKKTNQIIKLDSQSIQYKKNKKNKKIKLDIPISTYPWTF